MNNITIRPNGAGAKILFDMDDIPNHQAQAIMDCIQRNINSGKIKASVTQDSGIVTIIVDGIDGYYNDFVNLIESELITSDIFHP